VAKWTRDKQIKEKRKGLGFVEMPVIPVDSVVDKKRKIGKNGADPKKGKKEKKYRGKN
jgi:hypothetical protein